MIILSLIKTFLGSAVSFIQAYWRIILIGLILCITYYYKTAYEGSLRDMEAFKADIAELTAKTHHENEKKLIIANNAVKAATVKSQADMTRLNLDRGREAKNLKGMYENSQFVLNRTKLNYDSRLRLEAERNRLGVSTATSDTSASTSSEPISYPAAYRTLEQACQIETIDYNELRAWADSACVQVGCD